MNRSYSDITTKLGEPQWWDDQCVPRYCEFKPYECGVYDCLVVLVEIRCQECARPFRVVGSWDHMRALMRAQKPLAELIPAPKERDAVATFVHFGDPPNHDDDAHGNPCHAGATMKSEPVRVLEWWARENFEWVRKPEFEGYLPDEGQASDG
jgi:hypothetical protein